jgi:nitrous oxide reductase accessory protein NosL
VLAFQDRKSAEAFAGEHGGQVVKFSDFATQYQR